MAGKPYGTSRVQTNAYKSQGARTQSSKCCTENIVVATYYHGKYDSEYTAHVSQIVGTSILASSGGELALFPL